MSCVDPPLAPAVFPRRSITCGLLVRFTVAPCVCGIPALAGGVGVLCNNPAIVLINHSTIGKNKTMPIIKVMRPDELSKTLSITPLTSFIPFSGTLNNILNQIDLL